LISLVHFNFLGAFVVKDTLVGVPRTLCTFAPPGIKIAPPITSASISTLFAILLQLLQFASLATLAFLVPPKPIERDTIGVIINHIGMLLHSNLQQ